MFDQKPLLPVHVMMNAVKDRDDFWCANGWGGDHVEGAADEGLSPQIWKPPLDDYVKINVDGALKKDGKAGIGIILRDNDAKLLDCFAFQVNASTSLMCEALALKKGIQIAKALDLKNCVMESDNASLIKAVNGISPCPDWRCTPIIDDIVMLASSVSFSFVWIPRVANLAADTLANLSFSRLGPSGWVHNPHPCC